MSTKLQQTSKSVELIIWRDFPHNVKLRLFKKNSLQIVGSWKSETSSNWSVRTVNGLFSDEHLITRQKGLRIAVYIKFQKSLSVSLFTVCSSFFCFLPVLCLSTLFLKVNFSQEWTILVFEVEKIVANQQKRFHCFKIKLKEVSKYRQIVIIF